jgi:quercetin dioxygenase-like cupin family protein
MTRLVTFVGLATLCSATLTVAQQPASGHVLVSPPGIKWGAAPAGLPPGAEAAVLAGDPATPGELFTLRLKLPAGYKVPPHWHPGDESVTVVSGQLMVGMGETFDAGKMHPLPAGSFAKMPKEMRHYAQAKGATVIQVHGIGPFGITYVNAADDPRPKTN